MNAVIYQNVNRINGGLFDAFEYFMAIYDVCPEVKFIMVSYQLTKGAALHPLARLQSIFDIFNDRYNLEGIDLKKSVLYVTPFQLSKMQLNKILIVENHTPKLIDMINYNEAHIIVDWLNNQFGDDDLLYYTLLKEHRVTLYNEMPFFPGGKPYVEKLYFKRYRTYTVFQKNVFLTTIFKGTPTADQFDEIVEKYLTLGQQLLVSTEKKIMHPRVVSLLRHPKDFHSLFDSYLYVHLGKYFDPHPRLFHECAFYGKKIVYINDNNVDGSYYRYYDLIANGIEPHCLDQDDEIIEVFSC